MRAFVAAACLFATLAAPAQNKLQLSIDTIMRGPGLTGYPPRNVRWSRDGQQVYFQWKQYSDPIEENDFDTYVVNRDGKGLRKLTDDEANDAPPATGDFTKDQQHPHSGDLFVLDE